MSEQDGNSVFQLSVIESDDERDNDSYSDIECLDDDYDDDLGKQEVSSKLSYNAVKEVNNKHHIQTYDLTGETESVEKKTNYKIRLGAQEKHFRLNYFKENPSIENYRLHCTVCDKHLGVCCSRSHLIRIHKTLKVLICKKCYQLQSTYVDEEKICLWCYSSVTIPQIPHNQCYNCPALFCQNCLVRNFGVEYTKKNQMHRLWKCFFCEPEQIWLHRILAKELVLYLKGVIKKYNKKSEAYKKDISGCCTYSIINNNKGKNTCGPQMVERTVSTNGKPSSKMDDWNMIKNVQNSPEEVRIGQQHQKNATRTSDKYQLTSYSQQGTGNTSFITGPKVHYNEYSIEKCTSVTTLVTNQHLSNRSEPQTHMVQYNKYPIGNEFQHNTHLNDNVNVLVPSPTIQQNLTNLSMKFNDMKNQTNAIQYKECDSIYNECLPPQQNNITATQLRTEYPNAKYVSTTLMQQILTNSSLKLNDEGNETNMVQNETYNRNIPQVLPHHNNMINMENKLQTQMNDNNSKKYFDGQLASIESEICKLQYQIDELCEQTKSIRPSIIEQSAPSNKLDSVENESSISCKSLNDCVLTKNSEYRNLPINNKTRNKLVTLNQNVMVSDDESDSEVQVINITPITESGSALCKKQSLIKHKIKSVTNLNGDCVQKPDSKMMNNDKQNSRPAKTTQINLIDLKPLQNGIVNFQHVLGSVLNITKYNECKIKESGSFKSKTSVASKMIQKFLYDLQMCTKHIKILQNNIYKSYKNVPDVVNLENEDIITTERAGTSTKRFDNISVKNIKIKAKSQLCLNDAASFHPSNDATSSVKRRPTVETNQNVKRSKLCNDISDKNDKILNLENLKTIDIVETSPQDNTSLMELSCSDYSELYKKYKIKQCSIHLQPLDNNLLKWLTDAN